MRARFYDPYTGSFLQRDPQQRTVREKVVKLALELNCYVDAAQQLEILRANAADPTPIPNCQNGFVKIKLATAQQTSPAQADPAFFLATAYRIGSPAVLDYFQHRGGVRTFGYPVSNEFTLLGKHV